MNPAKKITVLFRPMVDGEEGQVVDLWLACGLTRAWNDPWKDIAFARSGPASDVLVGLLRDRIVASAMVGHDGHRGMVYYLAVHPDHRRKGLGRQAMRAAERWLKERGVGKLNLMIRSENAQVRAFYEALGYTFEDRINMSRKLAEEE